MVCGPREKFATTVVLPLLHIFCIAAENHSLLFVAIVVVIIVIKLQQHKHP